jgi:hypothetical protein
LTDLSWVYSQLFNHLPGITELSGRERLFRNLVRLTATASPGLYRLVSSTVLKSRTPVSNRTALSLIPTVDGMFRNLVRLTATASPRLYRLVSSTVLTGRTPISNRTALSLIPTVDGNTVRSLCYARTTVRSPRKLDHGLTL